MYGDLIREYREKMGINQGELAERLQAAGLTVTRAAVSHWETGRYPSPLDTAHDILILAEVLRINLQEILGVLVEDSTARKYSDVTRTAARLIEELPADAQQTALEQLRSLTKLYSPK